jgi:hypothetical protein
MLVPDCLDHCRSEACFKIESLTSPNLFLIIKVFGLTFSLSICRKKTLGILIDGDETVMLPISII